MNFHLFTQIVIFYLPNFFCATSLPIPKYIIKGTTFSTPDIPHSYKYNFEQYGIIAIMARSPINSRIQHWIVQNVQVGFNFESKGRIEINAKENYNPNFYDFKETGELNFGISLDSRLPFFTRYSSNGFLKLASILNERSFLEAPAEVLSFYFKSSGFIELSTVDVSTDYVYYKFRAYGTMDLFDTQKLLIPVRVIAPKVLEEKVTLEEKGILKKSAFSTKVVEYLKGSYWKYSQPNLEEVLRCLDLIYDNFKDPNHLCIFTANTLFATSGFLNLKQISAKPEDKWCSRGIIMVTTESNYRKMARAVNDWRVYNDPESVASLSEESVMWCLKFYNHLIEEAKACNSKFEVSWIDVLKLISPEEVDQQNNPDGSKRREEYDELRKVLFGKNE